MPVIRTTAKARELKRLPGDHGGQPRVSTCFTGLLKGFTWKLLHNPDIHARRSSRILMEFKWVAKWIQTISPKGQNAQMNAGCLGMEHPFGPCMPIMSTSWTWQEFVIDRNSPWGLRNCEYSTSIQWLLLVAAGWLHWQSHQEFQSLNCVKPKLPKHHQQRNKGMWQSFGYMIQLWMKSPFPGVPAHIAKGLRTFFRRPARLCVHCIGHANNRNGKHTTGKGRKQLHASVAISNGRPTTSDFSSVQPRLEDFLVAVAPKGRKKGRVPVRHQHPSWILECLGAMNDQNAGFFEVVVLHSLTFCLPLTPKTKPKDPTVAPGTSLMRSKVPLTAISYRYLGHKHLQFAIVKRDLCFWWFLQFDSKQFTSQKHFEMDPAYSNATRLREHLHHLGPWVLK